MGTAPGGEMDRRDVLRRVRFFADLDDRDCDAILAVVRARRGPPGGTLFQQGERGESLMIVLDGELLATARASDGSSETIARLGPGECVGELAFLDAEPRSATVTTPSGATVLELSRDAIATLRRDAPRVCAAIHRNVLHDLARRLREVGAKLSDGAIPSGRPSAAPSRGPTRALRVDQLRAFPALAGHTAEDLELLAFIATLRAFARGEVLMHEGAEGDACWLIVAGEVAVTRATAPAPLATLGPGALVGQLALLDRAPRSATVTATRDTHALEVRADTFANLLRAHSPVALRFQEQVAIAAARELRRSTRTYLESASRASLLPMSGTRMLEDDWDDGASSGAPIELGVDPRALRR